MSIEYLNFQQKAIVYVLIELVSISWTKGVMEVGVQE